jgi:hypothetical protein
MKHYILLFIFVLSYCTFLQAQEVNSLFKCSERLDSPYGFCAHITRTSSKGDYNNMVAQLTLMKRLEVTNVRSDIDYSTINNVNTGILDDVIKQTSLFNVDFLGIAYDPELYKEKWDNNFKFLSYLSTLENRYAAKMKYIEFFNEVNYCKQNGIFDHYITDLQQIDMLKNLNGDLKILFSGIGDPKGIFLDQMMAKGAYRYFDIMNLHIYPDSENQLINYFHIVRANMDKYHWNKPVWITEIGMHTAQTSTDNTNMEFFIKVVPVALKKIGLAVKGLKYGILHDPDTGYSTLNDDEADEYVKILRAIPVYITLDQLRDVNVKALPVLVATSDESFPDEYFQYLFNYVKKGGTIILPYGAPFYYNRTIEGLRGVGNTLANQLHIGELFWWDEQAKKLSIPEVPSFSKADTDLGVNYTYTFNKEHGCTARYLTNTCLKDKDQMIPITFAGNDKYQGVVAALYQLNSNLKGNIIIQTRLNTTRFLNRENEQARRIARFYLTSFAYGINKVFWYNFRSYENNLAYSEDNYGVVHKNLSPKPAYYAYKALTTFCPNGSTRPTLEVHGDIYISKWVRPDGKRVWAVWDTNGICYQSLSITGKPKYYDYLGNVISKISENNFKVGSGVTYIVEAENINIKQN